MQRTVIRQTTSSQEITTATSHSTSHSHTSSLRTDDDRHDSRHDIRHENPRYLTHGHNTPTTAGLEIENLELQATVSSQEELISQLAEDLRNVRKSRDFTAEVEILQREQQCMDLKEQLEGKELTILHLKNELVQAQSVTEEVYKKYERYESFLRLTLSFSEIILFCCENLEKVYRYWTFFSIILKTNQVYIVYDFAEIDFF